MKRILITGARGQVGLALYRLLKDHEEYELYRTRTDAIATEEGHLDALDITDQEAVNSYMNQIKPDIIINCTAMTAVDLCESEQEKAYRFNAIGPKNLAIGASQINAKLIHISTDYVFDGQAGTPYTEEDEPNPISVYGKSKRSGEELVMKHCEKLFILRTAWVYGEGKNFVKTILRLAEEGKTIRVVSDQYGTPTSALDLARTIIFLMETDSYGIYHATCEGSTNWYEFARTILKESGKEVEVLPITTDEYPTPAKRPKYSILDNKALREKHGYYMKDWKDAFREYIHDISNN